MHFMWQRRREETEPKYTQGRFLSVNSMVRGVSLIFVFLCTLYPSDYLWPVKVSRELSSTFGEYRPGHFHSGIDIKTNHSIGHPVYAIDRGYIFKVRVSPFGYGKVLYQRLIDSTIAVYAHLDRFSEGIEKIVREKQQQVGRFSVEVSFEPGEMPVAKGELIAYTGDSGTKAPHLHFEIRDKFGNPVNPLKYYYNVNDKTIPTIKEITFVPLTRKTFLNGYPDPITKKVFYHGKNRWRIKGEVFVSGKFGIEVKTYDTKRGIKNIFSPYSIQLFVNDSLAFQVAYDTILFEWTSYVDVDRNLRMREGNKNFYHRLYKAANDLPLSIYKSDMTGILDLSPGTYNMKIVVLDNSLNKSELDFTVESLPVRNLKIIKRSFSKGKGSIILEKAKDLHMDNFNLEIVNRYGVREPGRLMYNVSVSDSLIKLTYSVSTSRKSLIKVHAVSDSFFYRPVFIPIGQEEASTSNLDMEVYLNHMLKAAFFKVFTNRPYFGPKSFYLQMNQDLFPLDYYESTPCEYDISIPSFVLLGKADAFEIRCGGDSKLIFRSRLNMKPVYPDGKIKIHSQDSLFTVSFDSATVLDTLVCWIDKGEKEKVAYWVYPVDRFLKKPIRIEYRDERHIFLNPIKTAIYYVEEGKPEYLETEYNFSENAYRAKARNTGLFAVLVDTVPPVVVRSRPANGSRYYARDLKEIKIYLKDDLSGIKDDTALELFVDQQKVILEFNGASDYVRYRLKKALEKGTHEILLRAMDRCYNKLEYRIKFTIIG